MSQVASELDFYRASYFSSLAPPISMVITTISLVQEPDAMLAVEQVHCSVEPLDPAH